MKEFVTGALVALGSFLAGFVASWLTERFFKKGGAS